MDPVSILLSYLFGVIYFSIKSGRLTPNPTDRIFAIAFALVLAVISYLVDSFTQSGRESLADLLTLLQKPTPIWEESYE